MQLSEIKDIWLRTKARHPDATDKEIGQRTFRIIRDGYKPKNSSMDEIRHAIEECVIKSFTATKEPE